MVSPTTSSLAPRLFNQAFFLHAKKSLAEEPVNKTTLRLMYVCVAI